MVQYGKASFITAGCLNSTPTAVVCPLFRQSNSLPASTMSIAGVLRETEKIMTLNEAKWRCL